MSLVDLRRILGLLLLFTSGCQSTSWNGSKSNLSFSPHVARHQDTPQADDHPPRQESHLQVAAHHQPTSVASEVGAVVPVSFDSNDLTVDELVSQVLSSHPSLDAMYAAWQSAAYRYPQVVSLDDPMFGAMFAPASFGSSDVEGAYALELSQKFPWPGKRDLRGAVASAEAVSAQHDVETTRQKLAAAAQLAFWDFYLTRRQLELNLQAVGVLNAFRDNAQTRYRTGLVTAQDISQAEIELANLEQRQFELERLDRVATGRINVLLRRSPTVSLPNPAPMPPATRQLPDADIVLNFATSQRPEISAAAARIQAEQSKLCLTYQDFLPDAELYGRYDTFWQPSDTQSDLRGQVGVRVNIPTYRARLNSAVASATHEVARAVAEYEQLILDVQAEVQSAYEQVRESQRTLDLYSRRLLPAAEQNVSTARDNYNTAKITFLELAIAQRQLIEARDRQLQAEVELQRRLTTLRRLAGGDLPELLPPVATPNTRLPDSSTPDAVPTGNTVNHNVRR